jgi:hypothetical protein
MKGQLLSVPIRCLFVEGSVPSIVKTFIFMMNSVGGDLPIPQNEYGWSIEALASSKEREPLVDSE